jgi:hypothetical protein
MPGNILCSISRSTQHWSVQTTSGSALPCAMRCERPEKTSWITDQHLIAFLQSAQKRLKLDMFLRCCQPVRENLAFTTHHDEPRGEGLRLGVRRGGIGGNMLCSIAVSSRKDNKSTNKQTTFATLNVWSIFRTSLVNELMNRSANRRRTFCTCIAECSNSNSQHAPRHLSRSPSSSARKCLHNS